MTPFCVTGALRFACISKKKCQHPYQTKSYYKLCVHIDTKTGNYYNAVNYKVTKEEQICVIYNFCTNTCSVPIGVRVYKKYTLFQRVILYMFGYICPFWNAVPTQQRESKQILLFIFIQNVSHDPSVDDNLLLKENVP